MKRTRVKCYAKKISNKELEEKIRSYSGQSEFVLSIQSQMLERGFNKLSNKQVFFAEVAILREGSALDRHFRQLSFG